MKFLLIVFFLSLPIKVLPQPGDVPALRAKYLMTLSERLKQNPNDDVLAWERINLIFRPYFELTTKPSINDQSEDDSFENFQAFNYKDIDVLAEINRLINKKADFQVLGGRINGIDDVLSNSPSNLYLKKGQYYYLKNKKDLALENFLLALNFQPSKSLKEEICISIAAYYYNLDTADNVENYIKALNYLHMVSNGEIENRPIKLARYNGEHMDTFTTQKIHLLEKSLQFEKLNNYLSNIAISYLNYYISEMEKSNEYHHEHSYSIENILRIGFSYVQKIIEVNANNNRKDISRELINKFILILR